MPLAIEIKLINLKTKEIFQKYKAKQNKTQHNEQRQQINKRVKKKVQKKTEFKLSVFWNSGIIKDLI